MKTAIFDFNKIRTVDDFYKIARIELQLPEYFGNNLDALWDSLNGDIELPITIVFKNLSLNQLDGFSKLISLFEEAAVELDNNLTFEYYINRENL